MKIYIMFIEPQGAQPVDDEPMFDDLAQPPDP
jgi:hypothetical protein